MEQMTLQEKVECARQAISQSEKRYYEATAKANVVRNLETQKFNQFLEETRSKYAKVAQKLAEDKECAPVNRRGDPLTYDDARVHAHGITLYWWCESGPDDRFSATWEELQAEESKE